ncbi:hypothetical protein RhiirA4_460484 [Rhizophagus irregularis]|uniref:Crinkler effector protein N-terminal domain-containing protein n=1 Tax=Rhizophagus irregularis TaxID=588596 RepID=A0A2I1GGS2_9GLOM|nr:hypothetical protein RhiirA4_460484 [Rhizophagus irregularis]
MTIGYVNEYHDLISFIKKTRSNDLSYCGFLDANCDTIIASISSANTCNSLDTLWARHFLKEAELLLEQKIFISLKEKVSTERSQHKKYLQKFWQEAIEECERVKSQKRKQNEDKENVQPSKKFRSYITLFCWVRGDVPAAMHAITIKIRKENTIGELKDLIREKINTIIAEDIKLWKIEIPDNHDDELANFPLQNSNMLLSTRKIGEYWEKMPPTYIPNYFVDTEVHIDACHNVSLYADLLIIELKPADNAKRNRFIFEFKNKSVNFLDLQISGSNNNWEVMEQRAKKVEAMSISDVHQLKCGNAERFDKGKTIEDIFNDARKQLLNYVHNLKDDFHTSAFVVMSVGSRRLIWEKIN